MPKPKFDVVVEAVRYRPEGRVEWVRAYERRGATFSDHVLIDRQTLIEQLKSGKSIWSGKRIPYLASTFELSSQLKVIDVGDKDILVTTDMQSEQDSLEGVPVL